VQGACAILSSVALPGVLYLYPASHKRHDTQKIVIEHEMHVLVLPTTYV